MNNICSVDYCDNSTHCKNYCKKHYAKLRRTGNALTVKHVFNHPQKCTVEGCENDYNTKGYCIKHDARMRRNNKLTTTRMMEHSKYCIISECDKISYCKGFCRNHYLSNRYTTDNSYRIRILERCSSYRRLHPKWNRDKKLRNAMDRVRRRDNNHCKWYMCPNKDVDIHVNHIFPQSEYPELKYIERYMICYCGDHHYLWHLARGDSLPVIKFTTKRNRP